LTFSGFENLEALKEQNIKNIPAHTRKAPNRDGKDSITLPPDLPVESITLDIPDSEKFCPITKEPLKELAPEISHKLAYKPGSYYIKEIIRPKYALPKGEGILTAELPECLIPKCRADESFLADILTRKFVDHIPLYRICESPQRERIGISRRLLSQWVVRCGLALSPLYDLMKDKILESQNIFIDETPILLQETGGCITAYMWVMVGGNQANILPILRK
jgi:transposase